MTTKSSISLEDFRAIVLTRPIREQIDLIREVFDLIYSGLDEQVFRVIATSVKYAKEANFEGADNFKINEDELTRLAHIQDKNRSLQKKTTRKGKK